MPSITKTIQKQSPQGVTWQELSKHNTRESCWVAIKGKVYDVTQWLDKHPGGERWLLIGAGRDCTYLFESYHKTTTITARENGTYDNYMKYVGELITYEFAPYPESKVPFYKTMKTKVEQHFHKNNIDPRKTPLSTKLHQSFLVLCVVGCILASFSVSSLSLAVLFGIGVGCFHALCMAHVFHDLSHAAIGHSPSMWFGLGYIGDFLLGHSFLMWIHRHVVGHHVYTNISDVDPDVGVGAVYRATSNQPWRPQFAYQGWYKTLVYGLGSWKLQVDDFYSLFKNSMEFQRVNYPSPLIDKTLFWLGKGFWLAHRLLLPLFFFDITFSRLLLLFALDEVVSGYWFAFITQITHITQHVSFPELPPGTDWAMLQVMTTVDYGHGSFWNTYLTGCLNYQGVHHLFPSVNQYYYPEITPIIKQVCREYNVKYLVLDGWWSAFKQHIRWMFDMSLKPSD